MIEQATVSGRPAIVAYVNEKLELVAKDKADYVKATFTDEEGGTVFLRVVTKNGE